MLRHLLTEAFLFSCELTAFIASGSACSVPIPRLKASLLLSYPQRHDDVFVVVGRFAGYGHLGLGVGVFEVECDPQRRTALAGSGGASSGSSFIGSNFPASYCSRC